MQRIGNIFHHRDANDFSEGDHHEYVESGLRDVVLIGGAALVLIAELHQHTRPSRRVRRVARLTAPGPVRFSG